MTIAVLKIFRKVTLKLSPPFSSSVLQHTAGSSVNSVFFEEIRNYWLGFTMVVFWRKNNTIQLYFISGRATLCWNFSSLRRDTSDIFTNCESAHHPAGTSKDSDICDFSKVSDIENSMVVNGKIDIFKHPTYFSKDIWEIYI